MFNLQDTLKNNTHSFQITFKLRSDSINIDFHKFCKYSDLVQKEFLSKNIKLNIFQDCEMIQNKYGVKEENIKKFFEFLQDEKGNITFDQYADLVKLSNIFEVKSLQILLKNFAQENSQNVDFIISMILREDIESHDLMIEMEEILTKNITECLKNEKFSQLKTPVLYRIIEKSDCSQIQSDLLYEFIKKSIDDRFPLFYFIDLKNLSDENFEDLCENVSTKYLGHLSINLNYLKKLKNDLKILEDEMTKLKEANQIEKKKSEEMKIEIKKNQENEIKLKNENQRIINENKHLKETNQQISIENKHLKDLIDKKTEAYNNLPNKYLIPTRQEWKTQQEWKTEQEKKTEYFNSIKLEYNNKWYEVSCSSTLIECSRHETIHNLKNLFNEVKETGTIDNKYTVDCWVSSKDDQAPYIDIKFSQPVIANVLLITSRQIWFEESPSVVRIFGKNNEQQFQKLDEIMLKNWQASESRSIKFSNESPYQIYKIEFSKIADYVGFVELNLALD